jgi:hypothetical protein
MKNLRRLGLCFTLLCVLATQAFADGPCEPNPGQTSTPPCSEAQIAPDTDASGQNSASPESSAAEAWVAEITVDLIESVLSIF